MPAWSIARGDAERPVPVPAFCGPVTRDAVYGDRTGTGARVCVVDSGVATDDPRVGPLAGSYVAETAADGRVVVNRDDEGDLAGHGTACAFIIRQLAPGAELTSVRILDARLGAPADRLVRALTWAIEEEGFDLVNLSLSTSLAAAKEALHDLSDIALFHGRTIVAAAHNAPVRSFPWAFASVISVGSHGIEGDPEHFVFNPSPPVTFYAPGIGVRVPWKNLTTITTSGNSFAAPHVSGYCARIVGTHAGIGPTALRWALEAVASNVVQGGAAAGAGSGAGAADDGPGCANGAESRAAAGGN